MAVCAFCGHENREGTKFCIGCGSDALESECSCGRVFDYALNESASIHCPRCGRAFHVKSQEFEA